MSFGAHTSAHMSLGAYTSAHMSAPASLGAHTSAHVSLGAHTSAHTSAHMSFGTQTRAHTSSGAHTNARMCGFFVLGPYVIGRGLLGVEGLYTQATGKGPTCSATSLLSNSYVHSYVLPN